jgi:hypothetical protein
LIPRTLRLRPEVLNKFLGACFAINWVAVELLKPVFGSEQGIKVESQTLINLFGLDVDRPELICLPTEVKLKEGYNGDFISALGLICSEGPEAVLSVYDLYRRQV